VRGLARCRKILACGYRRLSKASISVSTACQALGVSFRSLSAVFIAPEFRCETSLSMRSLMPNSEQVIRRDFQVSGRNLRRASMQASRSSPRRARRCSCVVDGEAIVCGDGVLAVFDLIRGYATNAGAVLCARSSDGCDLGPLLGVGVLGVGAGLALSTRGTPGAAIEEHHNDGSVTESPQSASPSAACASELPKFAGACADLLRNDSLAVKRRQTCTTTNYDEI
jgi:hypothetical protein